MKKRSKKKKTPRKFWKWGFRIITALMILLIIAGLLFYLTLPNVSHLKSENPKMTAMMKQRITEAENKKRKLKIRQHWISLKQIPKLLVKSVILTEDATFYRHHGIDYHELKESIYKNIRSGKKARGGSTITQQLAKNLYLSTRKSYIRKLREMAIAKKLEAALSKERILELYLNLIEFGRGIFGVQAAARYFFKKEVYRLEPIEIFRLVAVIPKPLRVSPKSNSKYMKWRVNLILKRLRQGRVISEAMEGRYRYR